MNKQRREALKSRIEHGFGPDTTIVGSIALELMADIDALEERQRWIPAGESQPPPHRDVLVLWEGIPGKLWYGIGHIGEIGWRDDFGDEMIVHYWMEFPLKPEGNQAIIGE